MRKLEFLQSFYCKVAQSSQNFSGGWLCKRGDYKEVTDDGEYGSYEYLLLLVYLLAESINWWRRGGNQSTGREPLKVSYSTLGTVFIPTTEAYFPLRQIANAGSHLLSVYVSKTLYKQNLFPTPLPPPPPHPPKSDTPEDAVGTEDGTGKNIAWSGKC